MSVPKPSVISLVDNLEIICCRCETDVFNPRAFQWRFVLLAQAARVG
jgi:hypothetical protein